MNIWAKTKRIKVKSLDQEGEAEALGSGTFGDVWRIKDKAYKILNSNQRSDAYIRREARAIQVNEWLSQLDPRHSLLSSTPRNVPMDPAAPQQAEGQLILELTLAQSDLWKYMRTHTLNWTDLKVWQLFNAWICDLLVGLDMLHDLGVYHLDIKPINILVSKKKSQRGGIIKEPRETLQLADFDMVAMNPFLHPGGASIGTSTYRIPLWMQPEYAENRKFQIDYKADMWSLGLVLAQIFIWLFLGPDALNMVFGWTQPSGIKDKEDEWKQNEAKHFKLSVEEKSHDCPGFSAPCGYWKDFAKREWQRMDHKYKDIVNAISFDSKRSDAKDPHWLTVFMFHPSVRQQEINLRYLSQISDMLKSRPPLILHRRDRNLIFAFIHDLGQLIDLLLSDSPPRADELLTSEILMCGERTSREILRDVNDPILDYFDALQPLMVSEGEQKDSGLIEQLIDKDVLRALESLATEKNEFASIIPEIIRVALLEKKMDPTIPDSVAVFNVLVWLFDDDHYAPWRLFLSDEQNPLQQLQNRHGAKAK